MGQMPGPARPIGRPGRFRYPHLAGTVLLVAVLVPPFLLTHSLNLEPYPAVLFPSGHGVMRLSSPILRFGELTISGRDTATREWITLDAANFISPIPPWYFSPTVGRWVAVLGDADERHTAPAHRVGDENPSAARRLVRALKKWARTVLPQSAASRQVTEAHREELRAWLRQRLEKAGCEPDSLLIRRAEISYDSRVLAVVGREEQDVRLIALD
jgi:hypothetical protein